MVFISPKVYADDDDFQWTDDEADDERYSSSSDEDDVQKSPVRLDEANIDLIEDKEVRSIVESTNQREKEIFTGKGKKFAYPTEWKSEEGCGQARLKIHRVVDGLVIRILAMILVLVDVAMVLVSVTKGNSTANAVVSIVIVTYFLLELILRVFAWGKTFFKDYLEVFDGVVVVVAFGVTVVIEAIRFNTDKEVKWAKLVVILRFVRFFLYLRILYHTAQSIYMALRYKATQSKKRYQLEGYDLDLTYITEHIIAMSFPSSGVGEIKSLSNIKVDFELAIRNPREEVARFFNEKYPAEGGYKIYNLCKERGYPIDIFKGQVARYNIVDHNVPKMSELLQFCEDVEAYMSTSKDNVIAVHCKGGKGRTGCCIAAWLIYSKQFKTAKEALDFFGGRRMDVAKGVKFQGVETPSQKRYVRYLEMLVHKMGGKMPPVKELTLHTLEVRGLQDEVYSDLRMEVVVGGVVKYPKIKLSPSTTSTKQRKKKILMTFDDEIKIAGDVKFRFKSKVLGKDYDNCAFFFWIHTSFVEKNKFEADRYHIGNANKPKHNDKYNEEFYVKLTFTDPSSNRSSSKKSKRGGGGGGGGGEEDGKVKYATTLSGENHEYVVIDLKEDEEKGATTMTTTAATTTTTCAPNTNAQHMMIIDGKPDYPACTKTADPPLPVLLMEEVEVEEVVECVGTNDATLEVSEQPNVDVSVDSTILYTSETSVVENVSVLENTTIDYSSTDNTVDA